MMQNYKIHHEIIIIIIIFIRIYEPEIKRGHPKISSSIPPKAIIVDFFLPEIMKKEI